MRSFVEHIETTSFLYDPEGNPVYGPAWRDRTYTVTERDRRRITATNVGLWFSLFVVIRLMDTSPLPFLVELVIIVALYWLAWRLAEVTLSSGMAPAEVERGALREASLAQDGGIVDAPLFGTGAVVALGFCAGVAIEALFRPDEFSWLEVGVYAPLLAGSLLGDHVVRRHRPR